MLARVGRRARRATPRDPGARRGRRAASPPPKTRRACATASASRIGPGLPVAFTDPVPFPLDELVARYARTHGPFTVDEAAGRLGTTARARARGVAPARRERAGRRRRLPARRCHVRVVRRRRAARRAAALARRVAPRGRTGRPADVRSLPARRGTASDRAGAVSRRSSPRSSSCRAPRSRLPRSSATCSRRASTATGPRCSTSCARRASSCGSARARSATTTVGFASASATARGSSCLHAAASTSPSDPVHDAIRDRLDAGRRIVLARSARGRRQSRSADPARRAVGSRVGRRGHERHVRPASRAATREAAQHGDRARRPQVGRLSRLGPPAAVGPVVARRAAARAAPDRDRSRARARAPTPRAPRRRDP